MEVFTTCEGCTRAVENKPNRDDETCRACVDAPLRESGFPIGYTPKVETKNDPVNHPNHYQSESGLEVIEVIRAFTEDCQGVEGYYTGNAIKYICRWKKKNGLEDLKKARVYLNWLIEHEEKKNDNTEKKHPSRCGTSPWKDIHPAPVFYSNSKSVMDRCYPPINFDELISVYPKSGPCCSCHCGHSETTSPESNDVISIVWRGICEAMIKSLTEIENEKENKEDEK